jgi:hypothetical protein
MKKKVKLYRLLFIFIMCLLALNIFILNNSVFPKQSRRRNILKVVYKQNSKRVFIRVKTRRNSSFCSLKPNKISIKKPVDIINKRLKGILEINFKTSGLDCFENVKTLHSHKGTISIPKGKNLPFLVRGKYQVIINGEVQKNLWVR